jgi:hypothetical protein
LNPRQAAVVAAIRSGANIDEAAARTGVNIHTLRRWLSSGRKNEDGPYGVFAWQVDRLKDQPRGANEHARALILALMAFLHPHGHEEGLRLHATFRAIPNESAGKVMAALADHFIVAVFLQMKKEGGADFEMAVEEAFQVLDAINVMRETENDAEAA